MSKETKDLFTLTLNKPLTTHAGPVSTLQLKEPSGSVVMRHGLPFSTIYEGSGENQRVEVRYNMAAMPKYMADMTGLDEGVLEGMSGGDLAQLMQRVTEIMTNVPKN